MQCHGKKTTPVHKDSTASFLETCPLQLEGVKNQNLLLTCDTPSPVCSWQNATFRLDNIKAKRHLTRPPTISHMEIDACELSESKHGSSAPECSASLNNEWKWAAVCHFLRYKKRGHYRAFQNAYHRSSIILEDSTISRSPCLPRSIAPTSRSATRDFTHSLQTKYECGKWDAIGRWLAGRWDNKYWNVVF